MILKDRPCPICNRVDCSVLYRATNFDPARLTESAFSSRKVPEFMHFALMRCERCDLVYSSPAPQSEGLADAYRAATFDASRESEYAAKTYFRYLRKRTGARPVRALDIGAGDGAFLAELMRNGFTDVVGYEPSEAPVRAASVIVRDKIRNEMFDAASIAEGSFDLVTCFQTIEHVYEPLRLVAAMRRVLAPRGTAFLIGHNVDALSARVLGAKSPIFDIEHYQLFNIRSAEAIMLAAGFRSVAVFPIMNAYPVSYWLKLLPFPLTLKSRLLQLFLGRLKSLGETTLPLPAGNLAILASR